MTPTAILDASVADLRVDVLDLGGANYAVVVTNEGALVTLDSGDTTLLAGVEDWGCYDGLQLPRRAGVQRRHLHPLYGQIA